ncbi:hypothetical protein MP228_004641 [Amoeboaphelidium protococcarum]|nr:hypothetical protein MP228_004641 [Amoeboaphelidium protococcarum]
MPFKMSDVQRKGRRVRRIKKTDDIIELKDQDLKLASDTAGKSSGGHEISARLGQKRKIDNLFTSLLQQQQQLQHQDQKYTSKDNRKVDNAGNRVTSMRQHQQQKKQTRNDPLSIDSVSRAVNIAKSEFQRQQDSATLARQKDEELADLKRQNEEYERLKAQRAALLDGMKSKKQKRKRDKRKLASQHDEQPDIPVTQGDE